jgi:hypothetical protein
MLVAFIDDTMQLGSLPVFPEGRYQNRLSFTIRTAEEVREQANFIYR